MTEVIQYAVDAIGHGSIFALVALSLALLFSVMGLMNFAYGELIMIGAYTVYLLQSAPWPLVILATVVTVVAASAIMERLAFRPLRDATPVTLLITSFAISISLQHIARMSVGGVAKGVPPTASLVEPWDVLGIQIAPLEVLTAGITVLAIVALTLLLKRTMLGVQLRASTEDFSMAQLSGVRADYVIASAFVITGVLAAIASLVLVSRNGIVAPAMGLQPTLIAFVGAVIGGLGSLPGAAIGGFVLGALTTLLQATLPLELSTYTNAIVFTAVIAILVVRPQGLLVRRSRTA